MLSAFSAVLLLCILELVHLESVNLLTESGLDRNNIKAVVHDYKVFKYKKPLENVPDYYCRKFEIEKPEDNFWIHYLSHELTGLSKEELEKYYYSGDSELKNILEPLFSKKN